MLALFLKFTELSEADYHGFHITIFFRKFLLIMIIVYFICADNKVEDCQQPVCQGFQRGNTAPVTTHCYPCFSELGTRQHCRDSATMFSGQITVDCCIMSIFIVATPFRHRGLYIFRIFSCL